MTENKAIQKVIKDTLNVSKMSDLISREAVIDVLKQTGIIQDNDLGHCVIDEINRIPIAYDVDKIVEELICDRCEGCSFIDVCAGSKFCTECHKKIIEIVKQGCVSNNVCEWKIVDKPNKLPIYNTGCGKIRLQYSTGIDLYCNGCRKKIKVVK